MLAFLAELLGELLSGLFGELLAGLGGWVLALAYGLVRTALGLALYPFLLLAGWGRLWWRARGGLGWQGVWRAHGPQVLHRVGGQVAGHAVQGLLAGLLLGLAAGGVGAVLYGLAQHVGLL